jgi:transposase
MRILHLKNPVDNNIVKEKMKTSVSASDFKRWQIIYHLNNYSVDAQYLSDITGYSKATIYSIVQGLNNTNRLDLDTKPKGGRRRELMSIDEERKLMESLTDKALKGQILSGKDIRKVVEKKINRPVSDDYIWDLFKRNGWTKHSPRPHHPQKDNKKQEEFKKNSKTIWLPLKMILNQS